MGLLKGIASAGAKVGKALAKGVKKSAEKIKETGKKVTKKAKETAEKVKEKISGKKKQESEEPKQQPQQQPQQQAQQIEEIDPNYADTIIENFIDLISKVADECINNTDRSYHVRQFENDIVNYIYNQPKDDMADCIESYASDIITAIERGFYSSDKQAIVYYNIAIAIIRNSVQGGRSIIADSVEDTASFYFDDYEEM